MAGYSKTPLIKKLGIKEGFSVALINPPESYQKLLEPLPPDLTISKDNNLDFIQFFVNDLESLERELPELRSKIVSNGMIWVSWYKKSSGKPSELTEDIIRDTALALWLVDVKVCAVDENWSALKLVIPRKLRTKL